MSISVMVWMSAEWPVRIVISRMVSTAGEHTAPRHNPILEAVPWSLVRRTFS